MAFNCNAIIWGKTVIWKQLFGSENWSRQQNSESQEGLPSGQRVNSYKTAALRSGKEAERLCGKDPMWGSYSGVYKTLKHVGVILHICGFCGEYVQNFHQFFKCVCDVNIENFISISVTDSNAYEVARWASARRRLASGSALKPDLYLATPLVGVFAGTTKSKQQAGRVVGSPWQPACDVSFTPEDHGPTGQEDT